MSATASDQAVQDELQRRGEIPHHIAVIMDGNGRWARSQGLPRVQGHRAGVKSVRDVTEACAELGVGYLTLYTFSTENWHRPATEIDALMSLLIRSLRKEAETLLENDIRLLTIGDRSMLPDACRSELQEVIDETSGGSRMTLVLALSYSGRWEIADAVRQIAREVATGDLNPEDVSETHISTRLSGGVLPDPDRARRAVRFGDGLHRTTFHRRVLAVVPQAARLCRDT